MGTRNEVRLHTVLDRGSTTKPQTAVCGTRRPRVPPWFSSALPQHSV